MCYGRTAYINMCIISKLQREKKTKTQTTEQKTSRRSKRIVYTLNVCYMLLYIIFGLQDCSVHTKCRRGLYYKNPNNHPPHITYGTNRQKSSLQRDRCRCRGLQTSSPSVPRPLPLPTQTVARPFSAVAVPRSARRHDNNNIMCLYRGTRLTYYASIHSVSRGRRRQHRRRCRRCRLRS